MVKGSYTFLMELISMEQYLKINLKEKVFIYIKIMIIIMAHGEKIRLLAMVFTFIMRV
jgi:hypothetical protein